GCRPVGQRLTRRPSVNSEKPCDLYYSSQILQNCWQKFWLDVFKDIGAYHQIRRARRCFFSLNTWIILPDWKVQSLGECTLPASVIQNGFDPVGFGQFPDNLCIPVSVSPIIVIYLMQFLVQFYVLRRNGFRQGERYHRAAAFLDKLLSLLDLFRVTHLLNRQCLQESIPVERSAHVGQEHCLLKKLACALDEHITAVKLLLPYFDQPVPFTLRFVGMKICVEELLLVPGAIHPEYVNVHVA